MELFFIALQGFITGLGLIMVIGSQNAFILRHGILRSHVFLIATVSMLGDVFLLTLGVNGLGTLIQNSDILRFATVIAGSIFLLVYGGIAFRSAWRKETINLHIPEHQLTDHKVKLVLLALGFSILNPHAWLDAGIILGSIGGQFQTAMERHVFTVGAILASTIWFYGLALTAWKLAPYLRKPRIWQIINISVGCMMWLIAGNLIFDYFI